MGVCFRLISLALKPTPSLSPRPKRPDSQFLQLIALLLLRRQPTTLRSPHERSTLLERREQQLSTHGKDQSPLRLRLGMATAPRRLIAALINPPLLSFTLLLALLKPTVVNHLLESIWPFKTIRLK